MESGDCEVTSPSGDEVTSGEEVSSGVDVTSGVPVVSGIYVVTSGIPVLSGASKLSSGFQSPYVSPIDLMANGYATAIPAANISNVAIGFNFFM